MTLSPWSETSTRPTWVRKAGLAAVILAVTTTLAACATPADDESPGAPTTEESGTTEEETTEEPEAGDYTSDDVGNGSITVNGVEFPDFTGDCGISRNHGREDIGDLNEGTLNGTVAVDNVAAHEDMSMNFVSTGMDDFKFRDFLGITGVDSPADGEITSMTELGARTADGSRDIAEVRFAGVLDDGTTLEADIVCELQNAF